MLLGGCFPREQILIYLVESSGSEDPEHRNSGIAFRRKSGNRNSLVEFLRGLKTQGIDRQNDHVSDFQSGVIHPLDEFHLKDLLSLADLRGAKGILVARDYGVHSVRTQTRRILDLEDDLGAEKKEELLLLIHVFSNSF